jgi:hypothetical protein
MAGSRYTASVGAFYFLLATAGAVLLAAGMPHKGLPPSPLLLVAGALFLGICGPLTLRRARPIGRRSDIAGAIIVWFAVFFLTLVSIPVWASARDSAGTMQCFSAVKRIGTSMLIYASEYDDRLPPAAEWEDLLGIAGVDRCSKAKSPHAYAMNSAADGLALAEVENSGAILVFETESEHPSPVGGPERVAVWHGGSFTYSNFEGSARRSTLERADFAPR